MPCESYVAASVELEGGKQNQIVEIEYKVTLLRNGFALEWSTSISCTECERSGGHCGSMTMNLCAFALMENSHNTAKMLMAILSVVFGRV